jgi:CheY-specific phosphatase CheX
MENVLDAGKAKKAMLQAVVKTFSDMAFVETVEDPSPAAAEDQSMKENITIIDILKPVSATIILYISNQLKERIIANVYADQIEDVGENAKDDCLLEVLNVLSGNFLNFYYGKSVDYKIELPQLLIGEESELAKPVFEIHMNAEGLFFKVAMNSVRYRYP